MFATTSTARAASARPRAPRAPRRAAPSRAFANASVVDAPRWLAVARRARASRVVALAAANASEGESAGAEKAPRRVRKLPPRAKPRAGDARARDGAAPAPSPAAAADADPDDDDDDDSPEVFDMRALYGDDYDPEASPDDSLDDGSVVDANGVRVIADLPATLLAGDPPGHKSGYVAIVGRPNAGKSTLLNQLVGMKLSIVTYKPQTTRHRILGIVSEEDFQMVLLDTPGVMKEEFNKLDEMMLRSVRGAVANADVILVIVDAARDPFGSFEGLLPPQRGNPAPMGVIINKCDLLEVDEIKALKRQFEATPGVERVFPVSALAGVGHQAVQEWCVSHLPEGPTLYPKDAVSEHPERFFIAEIIREKIFLQYSQEVPYSTQVWIQSHKERDGKKKDLILAKVFVERKSQMGILIGAGGKALKELSTAARVDIEKFLGRPVYLDLSVKVKEGWRSDDAMLEDLGLDDPNRLEQPALGPAPDIVA